MGSWTQWSNLQITHEAPFMDLPVWPLRSWSHKCAQNEIQSLIKHVFDILITRITNVRITNVRDFSVSQNVESIFKPDMHA